MIGSQIMKFTKILYHEKLELYGIIRGGSRGGHGWATEPPPSVLNAGAEPRGGGEHRAHPLPPPPPPTRSIGFFNTKMSHNPPPSL